MVMDLYEDYEAEETSNQNSIIKEDSEDEEISNQNPTTKEALENESTSSQVNTSESMHLNIAEDNHENVIESNEFISKEKQTKETLEIEQEFNEKLLGLEIQSIATSPTNSGLIRKSCRSPSKLDIPLNEANSLENYEGQIVKLSLSIVNMEPATIEDFHDGDAQETSKSVTTHIITNASENLSQITKDSNFISIVRRELEQLVSNKHLALENLELLINFLEKKPSVHLTNNALSDRYKGFAYTCLVELLIFLQTHSVLDVLESNHFEFVGLLQDVRRFGFDKNWLDDVEQRALFPCLPSSQNALKNLLDSKHTLIQHLEDLKHQLEESVNQQKIRVLEVKDTFSTPLGY